jgi:CHAT domain-containing protein
LNSLAILYAEMGQYEKAESLYVQTRDIIKTTLGENHPDYASNLSNLAALYYSSNHPDKAISVFTQVMQIEQNNIRRVFDFSSEPAMRAYLDTVTRSLDTMISLFASKPSANPDAAKIALNWVLRRKAIILDSLIEFRQAERLLESNVKFAEVRTQYRHISQQLSNLPLNRPGTMTDAAFQQQMTKLQQEREDLQSELKRALSAQRSNQPADDVDVARLKPKLAPGTSLVEFVRANPFDLKGKGRQSRWKPAHYFAFVLTSYNTPPQMIDLGEAKAIDDALISTRISISEFGDKWQTDKSGLLNESEQEKQYQNTAKHLYDLVFAPVRKSLGAAKTIYLAADSILNVIPFEALVDQNGKYLVESFQFAYVSSGRDLLRTSTDTSRDTVIFAAPDYNLGAAQRESEAKRLLAALPDDSTATLRGARSGDVRGSSWKPLNGAIQEAADIEQELANSKFGSVKKYTGKEALEEVFKAIRSPKVLHVASHGFFLRGEKLNPDDRRGPVDQGTGFGQARGLARLRGTENPLLRSGIVLAGANTVGQQSEQKSSVEDGWVTAEEIAMMDLRGTELVVLSACESGLGDVKRGEGVYGLRRAFLYAGAKTLVMSLYMVPDEQTREMMKRMYASLKAGRGKLESLRGAQLKMIQARRSKEGAAHPFFWASFVLAGDPD